MLQELESFEDSDLKNELEVWLTSSLDQEWKNEILDLMKEKNLQELQERFSSSLNFGTAGVRALMGIGYNRLNPFTISKITLGLSAFIQEKNSFPQTVVIGYDSRNNSYNFATIVAKVLLFCGLKPIIFSIPCPSPLLAYATNYYKASVGIMITASHNPKEYNGYKVYNSSGGQFISEETKKILSFIQNIQHIPLDEITQINIDKVPNLNEELYQSFFSDIRKSIPTNLTDKQTQEVPVVYSPLFGAGKYFAENMVKSLGGKLILVEEENVYDGNFPGCTAPNPEEHKNFNLAIAYAKRYNAPLCILTDPDADRIGLWENGYFFNGNELGIILSSFLLQEQKKINKKIIISSMVSTQMTKYIAQHWGAEYKQTLTGFKYIGDIVKKQPNEFLFGFEESYGCLIGPYIQDKDAIGAIGLIYTMANYLYSQGKTFYSFLNHIYDTIAFNKTQTIELNLTPVQMELTIQNITTVRSKLYGIKVLETINFNTQQYFVGSQEVKETLYFKDLDKISLIILKLEHYIQVSVRPSGTEPKLKIYIELLISQDKNVDKRSRDFYIRTYEELVKQIKQEKKFRKFSCF